MVFDLLLKSKLGLHTLASKKSCWGEGKSAAEGKTEPCHDSIDSGKGKYLDLTKMSMRTSIMSVQTFVLIGLQNPLGPHSGLILDLCWVLGLGFDIGLDRIRFRLRFRLDLESELGLD